MHRDQSERLRLNTNICHHILSMHEDNPIAIYLVKPKSCFGYEGLDLQDCNNKAPDTCS